MRRQPGPSKLAGPPHRNDEPVSELESHLGYWLRFVSNHVSQSFQRKVEATGVTVSEWVVIREMHRLGVTSPGEIARAIGMTKGAASKLIARLQNKNLLTRSVRETDRRNHAIELTDAGRALAPVLARLADRNDEEFFGHLPERVRHDLMESMKGLVRTHRLKSVPID